MTLEDLKPYVNAALLLVGIPALVVLAYKVAHLGRFDSSPWQSYPYYSQCDKQIKNSKDFDRSDWRYQEMIDDCVTRRLLK